MKLFHKTNLHRLNHVTAESGLCRMIHDNYNKLQSAEYHFFYTYIMLHNLLYNRTKFS